MDVWDLLPLPPGLWRYVFAKTPYGPTGTCVRSRDALVRWQRAHRGCDQYVQLNPARRTANIRADSSATPLLQALLVDADPLTPGADLEAVAALEAVVAAVTALMDGQAPTVVDSGRGLQCWLRFSPPAPAEYIRRGATFLRNLPRFPGVRIDGTADLPRLARLPGTVNTKTGRYTRVLSVGQALSPSWLEQFEPTVPSWGASDGGSLGSLADLAPSLTASAMVFITLGADTGERHKACFAAAASLREAGATPESALSLLLRGAGRCSLSEADVRKIWRRVFGG